MPCQWAHLLVKLHVMTHQTRTNRYIAIIGAGAAGLAQQIGDQIGPQTVHLGFDATVRRTRKDAPS